MVNSFDLKLGAQILSVNSESSKLSKSVDDIFEISIISEVKIKYIILY